MAYDRHLISNGTPMEEEVGFSRAVRVGPFISVAGTASIGADGKTVGAGDVAAQTRQCIGIIREALEQAGSGLHDVARLRVLLTDIGQWRAVAAVCKEHFGDIRPACTIVAVSGFVNPDWLVELEADAIVESWQG
ncbi:MAG: RidA family protein [Roseovarius sp.]|nr:RidA family protein [Roseovarius sp.]